MKGTVNKLSETHAGIDLPLSKIIENLQEKIILRGNLPHVSVERQLAILDDLCSFPLGRFFLGRKGADGFWTDYIINHPCTETNTGLNSEGKSFSPVERFILEKCPLTLATRDRFRIFQKCTQNRLKNKMCLASVPCGIMRDLLTLDYSDVSSFSLIGVDLDSNSLVLAEQLAKQCSLEEHVEFFQQDAWNFELKNQIDLITSSGLNVYVSDKQKLAQLYRRFYSLLRTGGTLITSVLTYPPGSSHKSEWILDEIPSEDILMERILYQDILDCKWRNFCTSDEIYEDFYNAGFEKVQIIFDQYHIFPTVVAEK